MSSFNNLNDWIETMKKKDKQILEEKQERKNKEKKEKEKTAEELKEIGNNFFRQNQYEKAIDNYTKAINANPRNEIYYSNRAACLIKLKKFKEAENDCVKSLEINPKFLKSWLRKATANRYLKNYTQAIHDFQQVLLINSQHINKKKIEEEKIDIVKKSEEKEKNQFVEKPSFLIQEKKDIQPKKNEPKKNELQKNQNKIKVSQSKNKELEKMVQENSLLDSSDFISSEKPPVSFYEFEEKWRSLSQLSDKKNKLLFKFKFLLIISPLDLKNLFKDSFSVEFLVDFSQIIHQIFAQNDPQFTKNMEILNQIFSLFEKISQLNRFKMHVLFLSKEEKSLIGSIFDSLEKYGIENNRITEIKKLYK
ncbi:RNA polymerase ii-associated protein [Anaeramoeba ignava]|uniref:RNA polymerase II-associated protein 3 n=1 Tax=Anaeramoeba ignava TaxID=1746090 RepID=A0A9Q0LT86_ANAIG|nr:RNA polymerase ii-associated protein [Anaeramoeba ignava]